MNLPSRNTLTLLLDGSPLLVAEPTVAHIEALIAVEEKFTGDSISDIARRSVAQFTALCSPLPPKSWHLGEWLAYWKERRRIQGFVLGLTYQQLSVALSGLLAAAHGMDVEEYIKAINESEKKNSAPVEPKSPETPPSENTESSSLPSPLPSTNSPTPSE